MNQQSIQVEILSCSEKIFSPIFMVVIFSFLFYYQQRQDSTCTHEWSIVIIKTTLEFLHLWFQSDREKKKQNVNIKIMTHRFEKLLVSKCKKRRIFKISPKSRVKIYNQSISIKRPANIWTKGLFGYNQECRDLWCSRVFPIPASKGFGFGNNSVYLVPISEKVHWKCWSDVIIYMFTLCLSSPSL